MIALFRSKLLKIVSCWNDFWFGEISAYPIAAYRILLGVYLFLYLGASAPNVALLFSSEGVYSPFLIPDIAPPAWLAWILYSATMMLAVAFTFGYRTRVITPALFVLFLYHFLLNIAVKACSYDRLILLSLALMCFGETDKVWSRTSASNRQKALGNANEFVAVSESKKEIQGERGESNADVEAIAENQASETQAEHESNLENRIKPTSEAVRDSESKTENGVKAKPGPMEERQPKVSAWLTRLLALHLALFYLMTGLFKLLSPGWQNGEIIRGVMSSVYASSAGFMALSCNVPNQVFDLMALGVILFELSCPFFFFVRRLQLNLTIGALPCSIKIDHVQQWFFLCGFLFHAGVWLFMQLPQFMICPAGYVLFSSRGSSSRTVSASVQSSALGFDPLPENRLCTLSQ
jgi:hypothetical protein